MFTGIVEALGEIIDIQTGAGISTFKIKSEISPSLKIDQSVAHDGICLTVTQVEDGWHKVVAVAETLKRSTSKAWKIGDSMNLERAMKLGDRLDGHIVQGHVDDTTTVLKIEEEGGNRICHFALKDTNQNYFIDKGSVSINGTSLTVISPDEKSFSVTIIPYTWDHTSFNQLKEGDEVNLEYDMFGKYVEKILSSRLANQSV